jgi:hypothetical protein
MATTINTIRRAEATVKAYQGDTFCPVLTFKDSGGNNLDLTGITFKMQIKKKDGTLMQTLEDGTDIIVTLPNVVTFDVIIAIDKGTYEYDLQGTYNDGKVVTFLGGVFEVTKQVTV